jgi:FkbM family methyltransferase
MIDPSPENFHELCNRDDSLIFDEPDFDIVRAYHCALGSKPGIVTLYTNEDGSPLASLFPHDLNGENVMSVLPSLNREIPVPMQALDEVLARHPDMQHIDVLKMDVEGGELEVLKGASSTLSSGKIDIVTFEFGLHQVEARHFFRDFYQLLSDVGFRFHLAVDGKLSPIPRYDYCYENFTTVVTFVAERTASLSRSVVVRSDRLDTLATKLHAIKRDLKANIDAINKMQTEIGAALEGETPADATPAPDG